MIIKPKTVDRVVNDAMLEYSAKCGGEAVTWITYPSSDREQDIEKASVFAAAAYRFAVLAS